MLNHERTELIRLKLYTGSYCSLWMSIERLGTSPIYWIVDDESDQVVVISGTINWKDLKEVMQALQLYEYEKMEGDA